MMVCLEADEIIEMIKILKANIDPILDRELIKVKQKLENALYDFEG